jgi:hypothetical protein
VLTVLSGIHYLLSGPGFFREDWDSLAFARFDGVWSTAGSAVFVRRPLGALTYSLTFGSIGAHPLPSYVVLLLLNAATVALLYAAARCFLGRWPAAGVAGLYALAPSRSSLTHWFSTVNILAGMCVLLAGTIVMSRAIPRGGRSVWLGMGLVAVSTLFYDPLLAPAVLVVASTSWVLTRRLRLDLAVAAGLLLAIRGWWSAAATPGQPHQWIRLSAVLYSNFGWGIIDVDPLWRVVVLAVVVGTAVAVGRVVLGRADAQVEGLVLTGWVIVIVGMVPFARLGSDIDFIGIGDRASCISAIGAACVLVGLARMLPGPRALPGLAVAGLALAMVPLAVQNDRAWARTWRDTTAVLAAAAAASHGGRLPVWAGPKDVSSGGVMGITLDASRPLAVWTGDPRAHLYFTADPVVLHHHRPWIDTTAAAHPTLGPNGPG